MLKLSSLFEWKGYLIAFLTFVFTSFFYFSYSADWFYSLVGAGFTAALVWVSYLVIRMMILAAETKE